MTENTQKNSVLPDFLVISPSKSGTNTLYEMLRQHPEICMAKHVKGTRFFNRFYYRGIDWYSQLFSHCLPDSVKGEVDETYFVSESPVPERIHRYLPNIKLIICLRNPVDRAISLYFQFVKFGLLKRSFQEAVKEPQYYRLLVTDNFYTNHLIRFQRYFSKENTMIFLFEDLTKNMHSTIKSVYSFLGVDDRFHPTSIDKKFNPAQKPRFAILNGLAYFTLIACRHLGLHPVISMAKQSKVVKKLLFRKEYGTAYPSLLPEVKKQLQGIFQKHNANLAEMTGFDLSHWQQDP